MACGRNFDYLSWFFDCLFKRIKKRIEKRREWF